MDAFIKKMRARTDQNVLENRSSKLDASVCGTPADGLEARAMSSATAEMGKASAPLLPEPDAPRDWSHLTFLALVLNMLLASGPLTMPKAFHDAGCAVLLKRPAS